ncbi:MAG TPA: hypothetical protein VFE02_11560 [Candidatus Acidoferrales bacterium]|nr:hypothetical protein [Candidatus Acidoferrales bacterium]
MRDRILAQAVCVIGWGITRRPTIEIHIWISNLIWEGTSPYGERWPD